MLPGTGAGPNNALHLATSSVRCAPASGGADAARRQEAVADSCLAFPHCDQHRIGWRVTPRTDHRAVD
jgi:hypothetical protein